LSDQYSRDFYFAFGFAMLSASLHTYSLVVELSSVTEYKYLTSYTTTWVLLAIELGLLVNVVNLRLRKTAGTLVSIIALLIVTLAYAIWYLYSRQLLELLSKPFYELHPEAAPQQMFGLIGATELNVVVMVMSFILLIWQIKALRGALRE
jgi:hypothetical protein